jgi:hypothetical protein
MLKISNVKNLEKYAKKVNIFNDLLTFIFPPDREINLRDRLYLDRVLALSLFMII